MKEFFKPTKTDKIIYRTSLVSGFIIIATFLYTILRYFTLPPFIPVFNQLPWGNQRIGSSFTIFIPLILTSILLVGNLIISSYIYLKTPLLSRLFAVTTLLVCLLMFIFTMVIINLIA